jgi:transposase
MAGLLQVNLARIGRCGERGKRRPGKQPGDPGVTMCLVDDPDESYDCPPAACRRCGAGLAGEPVTASRRHQVTDIEPPPGPKVTQYVAQAKVCPCCGTVTEGARRMSGREPATGRRPARRPRT